MARVNVVAWHNGGGLSRDVYILLDVLRASSYEAHINGEPAARSCLHPLRDQHRALNADWRRVQQKLAAQPRYEINLFLEEILPAYLPFARQQALIPNPEWFRPESAQALSTIDWVLCKTRSAQATFEALGRKTRFIGFTSFDRFDPGSGSSTPLSFLHLAGRSWQKGTQALIELWGQRPDWPSLTLVQSPILADGTEAEPIEADNVQHILKRLDDMTLQRHQNAHGIHLCPSEAEGFGHTIVEAMSCAALTLTTDAPPMNELVTPDRGVLVGYHRTYDQNLATAYEVSLADLERKIDRILTMDVATRRQLGIEAQCWYKRNDERFRRRLIATLEDMGAIANA